jgi:NodT family efflux transporter outer membrane factor (OMF) lipoprotein
MKTNASVAIPTRFKRTLAIAIAASLLLCLSGCGIPRLRGSKPAPCEPGTFNGVTTADNSSQIPIADFFQDPQLMALIDQALWGNQDLRILSEAIEIANNEIRRRRGAYLPFVGGQASAGLDKLSTYTPWGSDLSQITSPAGGPFPNPLPDFLVAGNFSWQIDIWRQLRNARDVAGLRFLGSIDARNYVQTRLVAEIAENYYNLMSLDNQMVTLDQTIALQEQALRMAKLQFDAAQADELGVQRFQAEVQKNQSQKLIIRQSIIETENRINFLCGRYPQAVERNSALFLDLQLQALRVGVPSDLLRNRPDIREAERELSAAGLDIRVARANFFPKLVITGGVGYEAFNSRFLFISPESLIYSVAGNLTAPLINRAAIRAEYMNANAIQLQALYEYQRKILNAFTEVVNRVSRVQNYGQSVEIKRQQVESLEKAVSAANKLYQAARIEYLDVLTALRDRNDARIVLMETKQEQLAAVVNAYQALGGGWRFVSGQGAMPMGPAVMMPPNPVLFPPFVEDVPVPLPAPNGAAPRGPMNEGPVMPVPPAPPRSGPPVRVLPPPPSANVPPSVRAVELRPPMAARNS